MVRRRSTVRFRNGAPAQENNSNIPKLLGSHSGSQVVRISGKISVRRLQDIQHGAKLPTSAASTALPFPADPQMEGYVGEV